MREPTRLAGLASGQSIPCKAGDRRTVVVTRETTFKVSTRFGSGSQEVDILTAAFATDRCASLVVRAIVTALRDGRTDEQARDHVRDLLLSAYADEAKGWYRDNDYLADLDRAIDIFTSPAELDVLNAKAAQLRDEMVASGVIV